MKRNPYETRVVITGLGTINPLGYSVEEFWGNLLKGKCGVRLIQNTDVSDFPVKVAGEVDFPDNVGEYIHKKMLKRLDRFIIFSQIASKQAFKDSGIEPADVEKDPVRYGAIIGTGDAGNGLQFRTAKKVLESGMESVSPFYVVGIIPNTPAGYFAKDHNFQGPNFSVTSACATSNHAIGNAAMMIKMGHADVMMAGGTEGVITHMSLGGFNAIYALSRREDPLTASRPYDKDRDGFVLSEGAGILCLEELEHAKKRGAKIYAELTGFGLSCDAYDLVAPHPEGRGATYSMKTAIDDAGLNIEDIDVINSHGTSTPLGDRLEAVAIHNVFGDLTDKTPVHSTKSMLGHMVGASGGTEAIACIQTLQKNIIHPSINIFEQDPDIDLFIAANKPMEKKAKHVLSNSFGFGGQNSTIILSEFEG